MENGKINSLASLYKKVLPALRTKVHELNRHKIYFYDETELWKALRKLKWDKKSDLSLYDIVNDILSISEKELLEYASLKEKEQNE